MHLCSENELGNLVRKNINTIILIWDGHLDRIVKKEDLQDTSTLPLSPR